MGSIFGALAYMVFVAGLISTTGDTTTAIKSQIFVVFLCGLAGFSAKWMVQVLENIKDTISVKKS
jgi:hypothetical protein